MVTDLNAVVMEHLKDAADKNPQEDVNQEKDKNGDDQTR
jgi:hypothetical protein